MSLLKHQWVTDRFGKSALCVQKSRGKINMNELADYLRYDAHIYSHWAIMLNATESTCDVGWPEDEPKGDKVFLYQLGEGETCPVCAQMLPPEYCPHCGEKVMDEN